MVKAKLETLLQEGSSDIAIRKEILKEVIYKLSNLLATGTKIIPVKPLSVLDVKMSWPSEHDPNKVYPIAEGALPDLQAVVWTEYDYSLDKAIDRFRITDEAVIRGLDNVQNQTEVKRVSEAIAKAQDANIIDAIVAGAHTGSGYYVNVASGAEWNTANGDPEADIIAARELINTYSNITAAELRQLFLLCNVNVSSQLLKLQLIGNVQQSMANYLKTAFGIDMLETRDSDLADTAYLVATGRNTGEHGVYTGGKVPLVERVRRHGVGDEYIVKKWFGTKIMPESSTDTDNYRIVKINNTHA